MTTRRIFITSMAMAGLSPLSLSAHISDQRKIIAAVVGQSNEGGAAKIADPRVPRSAPTVDPVAPNGGLRSWWPTVSYDLLTGRNVWLVVRNTAVGSTSLAESWVGRIRLWIPGMLVTLGSYVHCKGSLYKCVFIRSGMVGSARVEPSNLPGSEIDGITWRDMGLQRTSRLGIIARQNSELFDPNGHLKKVKKELESFSYAEKWVFISIGQGDKTFSVNRAEYAQALEQTVEFFTQDCIKVFVGFTCYGLRPGLEDWYQNHLLPAWDDTVHKYKDSELVREGANLRRALGVLPISSDRDVAGLSIDGLHLNEAGYAAAAIAWQDTISRSGWV